MLSIQIEKVIKAVLKSLHNYSEQNSCILATAILIDTINQINTNTGIYPLTVETVIYNPTQTQQFKSKQKITGDIRVIGHQQTKSTKSKWSGHLVALLPSSTNKTRLIDLTITQVNSEKENINLMPIIVGVTENFLKINERLGVSINGCYVTYRPFPQDASYKDSQVWEDKKYRETITNETLLLLK